VLVWCGCGAVVVRAGLGEGYHLWATVSEGLASIPQKQKQKTATTQTDIQYN